MTCPICEKDSVKDYRPFCSKRCADLDLAHWMNGRYAIPAEPGEGEDVPDSAPTPGDRKIH